MTRAKWVALAVGLAVIAVLVPNGPALWMAVAYEGDDPGRFETGSAKERLRALTRAESSAAKSNNGGSLSGTSSPEA